MGFTEGAALAAGTAAHHAARLGREAALAVLLEAGADVGRPDEFGATALMKAATAGEAGTLALLLAAGADASLTNSRGQTALEAAQANHRDRCVELLDPELAEYLEEDDL